MGGIGPEHPNVRIVVGGIGPEQLNVRIVVGGIGPEHYYYYSRHDLLYREALNMEPHTNLNVQLPQVGLSDKRAANTPRVIWFVQFHRILWGVSAIQVISLPDDELPHINAITRQIPFHRPVACKTESNEATRITPTKMRTYALTSSNLL